MKSIKRLVPVVIAATAVLGAFAGSASAAGAGKAVFVQTDNTTANHVIAYSRAADGTLTQVGSYATGGVGGQLEGSVVDHTASQGSLTYDSHDGLLYAVNAGSNTVSVFAVFGDRLALRQVISSGGTFPVSVDVSEGLVYVLNAEAGGSVSGFRIIGGRLVALAESTRALGLNPAETPQFTHTPGQVAFSPDGSQLIVTTKGNGNAVDVFQVNSLGILSASPTVNVLPGAVPFAVAFDRLGHLLVTEAGPSALADFQLHADGEIAQLAQVGTEQVATCWVVRDGSRFYTSNAGSSSVNGFQEAAHGQVLTPLGLTATDAGSVDAAVSNSGRFIYVQTGGAGVLDEFEVGTGGTLSSIGSVAVPGAIGGEGIVAF
jgi:6-phosphogluconolactonase (cycloisomerase 2 family)